MAAIKFKQLKPEEFYKRYPTALDELRHNEDVQAPAEHSYGEVNIPGHGRRACITVADKPVMFYDDDDGWNNVPDVEFVKVTNYPRRGARPEKIEFDEMCVVCQNEGPHDVNDRAHVMEDQE
jgi:hypothetical protein